MVEGLNRAVAQAGARIMENVANFLPGVIAFLLATAVSFVAALVVRYLLLRMLRGLDFDRRAELMGMSFSPPWSASTVAAAIGYWIVLAVGLLVALTALDAALPTQFATSVLEYVPDLLAGVAILVAGSIAARFLARAVLIGAVNMAIQQARLLSLAVKWMVLIVAAAMALDHLGIGRTILLLAFGIIFGGIVLAAALAVGLGARDAVGRALERQLQGPSRVDKLDHL